MKLRRMNHQALLLSVLIWAVFLTPAAFASPPDPNLSTVPRCLGVSPSGGLGYRVTIIGTQGPVVASVIEIRMTTPGDTLICWCATVPGPRPRSFFQSTNASGVATFNITAGGCIQYGLAAIPGVLDFAAEVFADAVKMQECGTVSPDAVDAIGRLPTNTTSLWDPAGACATGLADGVQHTTPLATATYNWCTDINCDNVVGLADASILTPFLASAASCAGNAGP